MMNLEPVIQSDVSQKEKDKHHILTHKDKYHILTHMCFPCGSAGKEFACNARDLGSIPGLGRSPGGGKGYHFKRASLVAQRLKHLPAMRETWVQSLGREDPLEKEIATYSSILAWKIPWMEEPGRLQSMGQQRVRHD